MRGENQLFGKYLHKKLFPYVISPSGVIPSVFALENVKKGSRVLIIGDYTKKEYNVLSQVTDDIYMLDIVDIKGVRNFTKQSITERTRYPDGYFDTVIMFAVIEHLFEDCAALKEIRRILKDDGYLLLSIPHNHDIPEYHVRVHTFRTMRRLLSYCGFAISEHYTVGCITTLSNRKPFCYLVYLPAIFLSRNAYIRLYYGIERLIGTYMPSFQMIFSNKLEMIKAHKAEAVSHLGIQVEKYGRVRADG